MATNLNVVGLITIKAKTEGVPETISGIKGVDAAYQGLEKSTTSAGTATVTETKSRLSMADAFARQERRLVEVVRQQQEYNKVQKLTTDFARQFPAEQERANAVLASAAQRYGQISQATAGSSTAATRWSQALVEQRAKFDPLFAAGQKYRTTLTEINQAYRVGAFGAVDSARAEQRHAAAIMDTKVAFTQQVNTLRGVREANDNAAASTQRGVIANRLANHELVNLSRQAQDVVVSLGSGQSFGTVLLQQGTQIADVFANSSGSVRGLFDQIVEGAKTVFTPMRLVVGGVAAIATGAVFAAASWKSGQREIEKALIGVGQRSGVTANDINKIGEASSSAFGLSTSQARESATEFAKTGNIYRDNIEAVTKTVHGFAILTGKDTADAAKELAGALGGDLVKGAEDLDAKLGFLSGRSRELIINLQNQNKIQEAQKIIIDGVAKSTERATQTLGPFEKAWAAVGNAMSKARDAVGQAVSAPPKQDQLNSLTTRRDALQSGMSADPLGGWGRGQQQTLERLNKEIEKLQQELAGAAKAAADSNFDKFSKEADNAVRAMIPQIEQTQKLEGALADLKRAQGDSNVSGRQGLSGQNEAATRAIEVQLLLLKESSSEADRYNQRVLQIAASYSGVGVSTALVLDQQKQQLAVAEASGTGRQLEAQEAARINELLSQRKSLEEATRIAAGERRIAQAQITAGAREQLHALQAQLPVAQATTGAARMRAEAEATVAGLLRSNVDATTAMAVGEQQLANARASANAAVVQQTQSLNDQAQLTRARMADQAQMNGDASVFTNHIEAATAAQQAYNNAIRQGADETEAMGLKLATLASYAARAAEAVQRIVIAQNQALQTSGSTWGNLAGNVSGPDTGNMSGRIGTKGSGTLMTAKGANALVKQWQYEQEQQKAWQELQDLYGVSKSDYDKYKKSGTTGNPAMDRVVGGLKPGYYAPLNPGGISVEKAQRQISGEDQLAALRDAGALIGKTGEEKARLESQQTYKNLIRDGTDAALAQAIANQQLQNAMAELKTSVDANTESQLDAIYTQGHAALKIGYYGEGSSGGSINATDWGTSPSNPAAGPVTTGPNAPNVSTPWPNVGGPGPGTPNPNGWTPGATTPDPNLYNPNIPHPGMVWRGAGIAGGSWIDANSPWAHVQVMAEGGVIPPNGLAYVGEHGPNPRFMRAGSEAITVSPHDLTGTAYLPGDSHTWYGPGGARWDDRSGSVAPPWYPSTPEARGWSHSSPSNVIPFPGITGTVVDPSRLSPSYMIPQTPWNQTGTVVDPNLSHTHFMAAGGTIPPYGMAYVGEHGPNPRLLQAGGSPIAVTPNEPAKQDNQRAPPQQITIINNNFPPGSVFGDRRTRRQSAEGFGRAIAAYQ